MYIADGGYSSLTSWNLRRPLPAGLTGFLLGTILPVLHIMPIVKTD